MLKCDPLLVKDHVGVTNVLAQSQMDKVGSLRGTRRGIDARRGHGDAVYCSRIASRHG